MTSLTPHGPRICYASTLLPLTLLESAVRLDPTGVPSLLDVTESPSCGLQEHDAVTSHYGFVMDLDGPDSGAVWAVWTGEAGAPMLLVRPDCPSASPDRMDGCGLFTAHQGRHTWELYDRESALARARLAGPCINHSFE